MISAEFRNLYGNTEVTGQNPDCNADYYLTEDQQRDHQYMQARLYEAMQALSSDPSEVFQIIYGGVVSDSGSGQVDISAGLGLGKDADGNLYLVGIPALTNIAVPTGWNDDRQIWIKGQYARKLGASTRTHFIGETYHYSMADSYLGETDSDDLFVDADPSATSLVWDSFKMNGTTFTRMPTGRSARLGHLNRPRGLRIGRLLRDGNNPPTIEAGTWDISGQVQNVAADITGDWATDSLGDTSISQNYWFYLLMDQFSRLRVHLAWGDAILASTNIQSISSSGGGVYEIRVLNAVDLSGCAVGMVVVTGTTTLAVNTGVYECTAFSNVADSGGAGFKYIRVKNSSGAVQAGVAGTVKSFYRIKNITTAGSTGIYSPIPTWNAGRVAFVSDFDSSYTILGAFRSDGSGVVQEIYQYGPGNRTNDDEWHLKTTSSQVGENCRFDTVVKLHGHNYVFSDDGTDGSRITFLTDGLANAYAQLASPAGNQIVFIAKNSGTAISYTDETILAQGWVATGNNGGTAFPAKAFKENDYIAVYDEAAPSSTAGAGQFSGRFFPIGGGI